MEKNYADTEFKGSYTRTFQGLSELYQEFIVKLTDAIQRKVKYKETQQHLLKNIYLENANEDCQAILCSTKEREDVMGYLKVCENVGSVNFQPHINTIEIYAIQRQAQDNYLNCGKSYLSAGNVESLPPLPH